MSLIADIYGDDQNDTVVVRKHDVYSNRKVLYLLLNNRYKKICEVISREDDVERLYIESNHINAGDKGIRLIVRNTEMRPDYDYLDITFISNYWHITNFGRINTFKRTGLSSCVYPISSSLEKYATRDDDGNLTVLDISYLCARMDPVKWICN